MNKSGYAVLGFVLCIAHNSAQAKDLTDAPFGVWVTAQQQVLSIGREAVYRFCDRDVCATGKTKKEGSSVLLYGFHTLAVTKRLRLDGGEQEMVDQACSFFKGRDKYYRKNDDPGFYRADKFNCERPYFEFRPATYTADRMGWFWKRWHCQGAPCLVFGDQKKERVIFIKRTEY